MGSRREKRIEKEEWRGSNRDYRPWQDGGGCVCRGAELRASIHREGEGGRVRKWGKFHGGRNRRRILSRDEERPRVAEIVSSGPANGERFVSDQKLRWRSFGSGESALHSIFARARANKFLRFLRD